MTAPAVSPRPRNLSHLALALPGFCLLWAFWPSMLDLAQTWHTNPQYSHGFLVPVFAAALLWLRRDRLAGAELTPSLWGAALLIVGLLMRLVGGFYHYISVEQLALLPCVAGLTFLLGGWGAWRWSWPAVLFLGFMIPLPWSVATAMSEPLQRLATLTSTFVMQTLGLPALAEGNVILLNDHEIGIVEACSGLRMLVVFFALSTAVVLVIQRHWIDRTLILLSAVPIALISNIVRVTATGLMYEAGYSEMAATFFHDVAGWLMMPLALGMLWVELKLLSHLVIEAPVQGVPRSTRPPARTTQVASPRQAVPRGTRRTTTHRQTRTVKEPAAEGQAPQESVPAQSSTPQR